MKKLIIAAAVAGMFAVEAVAGEFARREMVYGDTVRTYTIYRPDSINRFAPLVVYTHGYGSKTRNRKDLNRAADRHGFVVCYPDGAPDTRGKDGWYVGYPSQSNMDKDEISFFKALLDEVWRLSQNHKSEKAVSRKALKPKYSLFDTIEETEVLRQPHNVFMAGMSNGGDLCYQLVYTAPGLFKAYASVAGLTFEWVYNGHRLTEPVDFMEIHGNADTTSRWTGDHDNAGGWGAYIPVPMAVAAIAANNRCATMAAASVASLTGDGRMLKRTVYGGSPTGKTVVLYEVDGGRNSWHAKDIDTGETVWQFFESVLKRDSDCYK